MFKKILAYIGIFCVTLAIMVGALDLVARIPHEAIEQKSVESAKYMQSRGDEYIDLIPNQIGSRSDYYADSISLSISYALDENDSLRSALLAKFATDDPFVTQNYVNQVLEGEKAEQEYLRYWHGYLIIIRPLMTFMNIEQIYLLNLVIFCGLFISIIVRLFRHDEKILGIAFAVAMIACWSFFTPVALEYIWMFLLMLLAVHITMSLVWKEKIRYLPFLLFMTGMWAAYFDFLTTETITVTMPLLFALWLNRKAWKGKEAIKFVIRCSILWLVAFAFTWMSKWVITGIIMGENVWPFIAEHIAERTVGDVNFRNPVVLFFSMIFRTIGGNMPFCLGVPGGMMTIFLIVTILVLLKEFRCKKYNNVLVKAMTLVCLITAARFIVLLSHTCHHSFFTFRALCAPMMAAILILYEVVDFKKFKKEIARIKK